MENASTQKVFSLQKTEQRLLSEEETRDLIRFGFSQEPEKNWEESLPPDFEMKTLPGVLQIITGRIPDVKMTLSLLCFIGSLTGVPGQLVQWAWELKRLSVKNNGKILTIMDWALAFPTGIPTDSGYVAAWDAQKINGANLLDTEEVWKEEYFL